MKIAVFPGSFDPFTKGHENVLAKALELFDEIIIAVGFNSTKSSFFTLDSRVKQIESLFLENKKIRVKSYELLTVDFCKQNKANFIIRGLRDVKDFEYERAIAQMNKELNPEIESVFFVTDPIFNHINSTIVREIKKNGGVIDSFVTNEQFLVR